MIFVWTSNESVTFCHRLAYTFFSCTGATGLDNIIYLAGQPVDVLSSDPSLTERMIIMVSWNDLFTFVIMLVAILTFIDTHRRHKK